MLPGGFFVYVCVCVLSEQITKFCLSTPFKYLVVFLLSKSLCRTTHKQLTSCSCIKQSIFLLVS